MSSREPKAWSASENYQWNSGDVLGRGATAVVCKARSLITGDECAVKVFHERVSHHYASVPIKELELLQRLKHRNIIAILTIEREKQTGNHVLAMELCSGGSVYSMLDQPKYAYGFPEEEFLIFLDDLAEGMRYLRINDIIHRDIKPGNIMRKVDENGRSIYQLTDFGAARHLQEEETFTSIYGTEEYLDPGMYEKAVLRVPKGQNFGADVDIWSLGVTIYHVCTGQLPFIPWGGRSNTKTMHLMTSKKAPGVISAVQRTENGEIEYRKELPRTCLLSLSLKMIIVPMLAGLMESDINKRMNFDHFFSIVKGILDMVTVKIFDCCTGINSKLYVNITDKFAKFQELVASNSDIPAGEQLILFHNKELLELVEPTKQIKDWPKKLIGGQFFLYQRERLDQQRLSLPEIPPLPQFPDVMSLDRDSYVAHKSAGIACLIEKYIIITLNHQNLMQESETNLRDFIMRIVRKINNLIPNMSGILNEHRNRQATFYGNLKKVIAVLDVVRKKTNYSGPVIEELVKVHRDLTSAVNDNNPSEVLKKAENRGEECKVYMDVLMQKMLDQESEAITNCVGCLEEDHCIQKAQHLCSKVVDIWSVFSKHRKLRTLSPEEEFCHRSDRTKLTDYCVQIISLLQGHCLLHTTRMYAVVGKQIALLLKNLQRTKKVEQNIASVNECREKLSTRVGKMDGTVQQLLDRYKELMDQGVFQPVYKGASPPTVKSESAGKVSEVFWMEVSQGASPLQGKVEGKDVNQGAKATAIPLQISGKVGEQPLFETSKGLPGSQPSDESGYVTQSAGVSGSGSAGKAALGESGYETQSARISNSGSTNKAAQDALVRTGSSSSYLTSGFGTGPSSSSSITKLVSDMHSLSTESFELQKSMEKMTAEMMEHDKLIEQLSSGVQITSDSASFSLHPLTSSDQLNALSLSSSMYVQDVT